MAADRLQAPSASLPTVIDSSVHRSIIDEAIANRDYTVHQEGPARPSRVAMESLLKLLQTTSYDFQLSCSPSGGFVVWLPKCSLWQCAIDEEEYSAIVDALFVEDENDKTENGEDNDNYDSELFGNNWQLCSTINIGDRSFYKLPEQNADLLAKIASLQ